jgi:RNA polymerase sigma-70 factor (ECF subfamily)
MGGPGERFHTTHWSEIIDARTLDETHRRVTVNELISKYWKPVYCYLRRKGYDNEPAKDITQGFFHEVVLGRELIQQADRNKGRFRTFLLTALDRYAADVYDKETAAKRSPKGQRVSLETSEVVSLLDSDSELGPDQAFHYAWASEVLSQVLGAVKQECFNTGKAAHWEVFHAKVIRPILDNVEPPPLKEICSKYNVDSEAKASDMIFNMKRRFRSAMKRHLRQIVESESAVEEEFNEVFEILSKKGTR